MPMPGGPIFQQKIGEPPDPAFGRAFGALRAPRSSIFIKTWLGGNGQTLVTEMGFWGSWTYPPSKNQSLIQLL